MEIRIGNTTPIKSNPQNRILPSDEKNSMILRKDRREKKHDRRKSVRDGVFTSFTFRKERRRKVDRRKNKH